MATLYPKTFTNLIECYKKLPGVGEKSAERMAYQFLEMDDFNVNRIIDAIKSVKNNIAICPICGAYMENNHCPFCQDETREQDKIIVVTSYKDALAFEKLNSEYMQKRFKTKETFKREKGNIQDTSITFIKDSKQISTHDTIYNFVNWNVLDDNIEEVPSVRFITFTIDGVEYQAIENMTWEEWVNSQYNINNVQIYGEYVHTKEGNLIIKSKAYDVSKNDIIDSYQYKKSNSERI